MATVTQYATVDLLGSDIISTMVVNPLICTEPCTVDVTVAWQNAGDLEGKFTPSIIVDGIATTFTSESLNVGGTISYILTISNLIEGIHTIDASPGPARQIITVAPKPHIISATLTVDKTDCTAPCTVNGTVSWTNIGGSPGTLDLSILVNNVPKTIASAVVINPGETTKSYTFSLPNLTTDTYSVCAFPDIGTTCQKITVKEPAKAGFGIAGMIVAAGLAIGVIYAAARRK